MPSTIEGPDYSFIVSTRRLQILLDLVLELGRRAASTDQEHSYINGLWQWRTSAKPNAPFVLRERFASLPQQKFWATMFRNLARRIFLREIGDHTSTHWQTTAIADAVTIARLLTESVRSSEPEWYPQTEDDEELAKITPA